MILLTSPSGSYILSYYGLYYKDDSIDLLLSTHLPSKRRGPLCLLLLMLASLIKVHYPWLVRAFPGHSLVDYAHLCLSVLPGLAPWPSYWLAPSPFFSGRLGTRELMKPSTWSINYLNVFMVLRVNSAINELRGHMPPKRAARVIFSTWSSVVIRSLFNLNRYDFRLSSSLCSTVKR